MEGSKKRFQFIGQTLNVFNVKMTVPCNIDKSEKETNAHHSKHCSLIPNLPSLHHPLALPGGDELQFIEFVEKRRRPCARLSGCLCDVGGLHFFSFSALDRLSTNVSVNGIIKESKR